MAKIIIDQPSWKSLDMADLRYIDADHKSELVPEIEAVETLEEAVKMLEHCIGFHNPAMKIIPKQTPIFVVNIDRDYLPHIVEKRQDARERYVNFALDTLENPYEIWEAQYDDGMCRYLFIGTYKQRYQVLCVVAPWEGKLLWNFMQNEAKSMNKHRYGKLLYQRHPA